LTPRSWWSRQASSWKRSTSCATRYGIQSPALVEGLLAFLLRTNVEVADADRDLLIAALRWTTRGSARRIPDAILAAAAERASCDWIATFDRFFHLADRPIEVALIATPSRSNETGRTLTVGSCTLRRL
jgi:hypothetical protein